MTTKKKTTRRKPAKQQASKPADNDLNKKPGPAGNAAVSAKSDTSSINIELDPVITIAEAQSLHEQLQGYLDRGGDLSVDASGVHMVDTAGLQLLLAFVLELKNQNRAIIWRSYSPAFKETVELLGLAELLGLDGH